jgi:hypothetical protein
VVLEPCDKGYAEVMLESQSVLSSEGVPITRPVLFDAALDNWEAMTRINARQDDEISDNDRERSWRSVWKGRTWINGKYSTMNPGFRSLDWHLPSQPDCRESVMRDGPRNSIAPVDFGPQSVSRLAGVGQ